MRLPVTFLLTVLSFWVLPGFAANKTITFIHLNDLHAHLTPHLDVVSDGNGGTKIEKRGGLTRIATLVKQIRADNPNSVLMNIGDTFHGGAEAFFSYGNSIAGPLNTLGIDVGVAGNWDFYYTPGVTRARYGRVNTGIIEVQLPGMDEPYPIIQPNWPNLGANMTDVSDFFSFFLGEFMPATHMMTVNGVKIGFIGLTSDIVEFMHPMLAEGFDFSQGETAHKDLINQHAQDLRDQGAKIVVVMSELGIHKSKRLADVINAGAVDVFFCGHTHEATYTPVSSDSGALVVEAGNDGYLGRMDIKVRERRKSTTIQSLDWTLLDVDNSVPEDPAMQALVDAERAPYFANNVIMIAPPPFSMQWLTQPLDTVVGYTDSLMDRKHALESAFNAGWGQSILQITGAEVSMTPGFRMGSTVAAAGYGYEDGSFATGEITLEDVFRFFPMVYGITTANVTGARLKEIIEEQLTRTFSAEPFNHIGGWNYGLSGVDMVVDLAAGDGNRLTSLTRSGTGVGVADDDSLTIAGCRRMPIDFPGMMCGYDGFTNITPVVINILTGEEWTAADTFVDAMSVTTFDGSQTAITDTNNTALWPEADFIQPLEGVGSAANAEPPPDEDTCGFFFKFRC